MKKAKFFGTNIEIENYKVTYSNTFKQYFSTFRGFKSILFKYRCFRIWLREYHFEKSIR